MVKNQEKIELDGVIAEALPNTMFRVKLTNGKLILCLLSGKMRIHRIKVIPGDQVKVEITPYDQTRGRIIYRSK